MSIIQTAYLLLNAAFCAESENLHLLLLADTMGTVHSLHTCSSP